MSKQNMLLYALVLVFIWLMFFRKSEGCCGPIAA